MARQTKADTRPINLGIVNAYYSESYPKGEVKYFVMAVGFEGRFVTEITLKDIPADRSIHTGERNALDKIEKDLSTLVLRFREPRSLARKA